MRLRTPLAAYAAKRKRIAAMGLPADIPLAGPDSPWFVAIDEMRRRVDDAGGSFVSLAHYDYLGLARHPEVLGAAHAAIDGFGIGAGGSRLIGGERTIHRLFEEELSDFLGFESTLLMAAGYLVGLALIPHLVGSGDLIVMDELVHSSAVHGIKATRATVRSFRHNDLDHLAEILAEERDRHGLCLIVAESLYSMDGDVVDLPRLLELRDAWDAWVMIDEAHSIGVLGATGRGLCEHFGVDPGRVDILVGTLSKTFVGQGGFVAARREVIEWLKYTLPGFVFSAGLAPVIVEAARAALRVVRREPQRVTRLAELSQWFVARIAEEGFSTGEAIGRGIVPVLFDDPATTMRVSRALAAAGFYAPPIMHVGLNSGEPRVRFFLSAGLATEDVDRAIRVLATAARGADRPTK